jgi:enamine deaminase RidA (YjgF/YER057c/UK114 family)
MHSKIPIYEANERIMSMSISGQVQYINPESLNKNPAFTNVVVITGNVKTIYIGGQDAVDSNGKIIGKGDIKIQTGQVLKNIQAALSAGGAGLEHIIKWNLLIVQGQSLQEGFEAFRQFWGNRPNPPLITAAFVSGLANPDFLIEMDAIAVVPE